MDLFPLWNSLRIALISSIIVFFSGIFGADYLARLPKLIKGALDVTNPDAAECSTPSYRSRLFSADLLFALGYADRFLGL